MNTAKVSHQLRLSSWTENIRDQQISGLSVRDWCSQNGFSTDRFYYWKRKLKEACLESALPDIVPLNLPGSAEGFTTGTTLTTASQNVPTVGNPTFTSCTTSILLRMGDVSFEIQPDTPPGLVSMVIKAVRNA